MYYMCYTLRQRNMSILPIFIRQIPIFLLQKKKKFNLYDIKCEK